MEMATGTAYILMAQLFVSQPVGVDAQPIDGGTYSDNTRMTIDECEAKIPTLSDTHMALQALLDGHEGIRAALAKAGTGWKLGSTLSCEEAPPAHSREPGLAI
jgi:hypothetical protein